VPLFATKVKRPGGGETDRGSEKQEPLTTKGTKKHKEDGQKRSTTAEGGGTT
jgi:hypothetical protein